MRSVYTQNSEHLNKLGVRATMDSKLEEQRSVLNACFQRVKNLASFFKGCRNVFLKPAYPVQPFIAGFHSLRRATSVR